MVRVIDGDTIDVRFDSGVERVRLIGTNSPEGGECYADEATEGLVGLVMGETVHLERDVSDRDQYGRLLRYVWTTDGVHVNVTSFNRVILLTGEVPDAATREAIERIVAGLPNVRSVANELEVAGVSSLTSRSNDSLITSKVKVRFLDARRFNALHVKVVTEAGIVYLMGIVTEQEGNEAAEVARTTGGVRKVVKVFEYCRPTEDPCRPSGPPPSQQARTGP